MPACWAGWAGSGPSPWSASKGLAVTAPDWLAMSPQLASGWSGWTDRTGRTSAGRANPIRWNAVSAARAAQSGRARGAPKGRDGAVEAIRALMVARRSAAEERTQTINQARALLLTGPDDLRARFTRHTPAALVTGLASLRPRPGDVAGYAVRVALRACSPCTGSARALRRCCSSRPGITPGGYAARRPGRTCAASPRSPRHLGKSPATGSTPPCARSPTGSWASCTDASKPAPPLRRSHRLAVPRNQARR